MKSENISILIGLLTWLSFIIFSLPFSTFSLTYVQILLLAAPLWLIPLTWQLLDTPEWLAYLGVPAGVILGVAYMFSPSLWAAVFSLPWLVITTILAWQKLMDWRIAKSLKMPHLCQLAAYLFLPIGAAWAFADRLGFQPLGFDTTIVLLTVAHFHYAGFLLPTITAFALKNSTNKGAKPIAWAVILGIPLVAIGITTTHLGLPVWIEIVAVTVLTFGGFTVGLCHYFLGWKNKENIAGKLWLLAGIALMIGMGLAFCYGWRFVYLFPALSIPWMYALHGSLNAIGFALPAILGWRNYTFANKF